MSQSVVTPTASTVQAACSICADSFNKSTRKPFTSKCCPEFDVCRQCVKTYIMGSTEAPACMSCKVPYEHSVLEASFTKKAMSDVALEQARLFKESQRALLPATMVLVERHNQIKTMKAERTRIDVEIKALMEQRQMLTRQIKRADEFMEEPEGDELPGELGSHREENGKKFVQPCAHPECRGFVSSAYKCGLCEQYTCARCQKPKASANDDNHGCNEADVLTVAEIKKTTKGCPKCGTRIFKISGCSQMFCTKPNCGTIFDWNTLRIQTKGVEHNPHIHAWREAHGITQGNGTEGGCPEGAVREWELNVAFRQSTATYEKQNGAACVDLRHIIRAINHTIDVDIRNLQNRNEDDNKLKQLRIKYLQSNISDDQWTSGIKTLHRAGRKNGEYLAIMDGAPEIFHELIRGQIRQIQMGSPIDVKPVREFAMMVQDSLNHVNARWNVKGYTLPDAMLRTVLTNPTR